jgi:predicted short-subunit dehydrogenase-like oxidoreductase (DUF2520 family)
MNIAVIGAGTLGTSLAVLLHRARHKVLAVCSRTHRSAQAAAALVPGARVVGDCGLAAMGADVVVLAVPDRAIAQVAIQVAAGGALKRGGVVAHLSGALPAGILAGVRAAGGWQGSMHPLQSFASVENALASLPSSFYFLEGDEEAVDVLRTLVVSLEGRPVRIDSATKSLYHAAACVASNYLVTLADYATTLMARAGVPHDVAMPALMPLLQGTLRNLETMPPPEALTGPIARGDVGTVKNHLEALRRAPGDLVRLYAALARKTVEVALRKGKIERAAADNLLRLLSEAPEEPETPLAAAAGR